VSGTRLEPYRTSMKTEVSRRLGGLLTLAGPYVGLLLVVGIFCALTYAKGGRPELARFLHPRNWQLMAVQSAVPATVALGMTIIMISGGIDLSVGYVVSLVTVTAMLTYRWADAHPGWTEIASGCAILAGIATGVVSGLANGLLITRLKVVPFVVTLGTMGMARGIAQSLSKGQPVSLPDRLHPPAWIKWLEAIRPQQAWMGVGPAVWTVVLLAVLVAVLLRYTVFGRYCYALGSNEATARLCGINVNRAKVIIYTLGGLLTGWAGILQLARNSQGLHDVRAGMELDVIAAVVIGGGSLNGGEGTVTGTLVGAMMLAVLENGCSKLQLPQEFRYVIIGLIIVGVSAVNTWRQSRLR
jgi:ribose transport system permease protein